MVSHPSRAALIKLLKRRRDAARTDRSAMWVLLDYLSYYLSQMGVADAAAK